LYRSFGTQQSLRIGVNSDKFNPDKTGIDHAVYGIASTSTNTDNFYPCE
jgi:hypothetical protein